MQTKADSVTSKLPDDDSRRVVFIKLWLEGFKRASLGLDKTGKVLKFA